jgi:hypothetical protein
MRMFLSIRDEVRRKFRKTLSDELRGKFSRNAVNDD